MAKRRAHRTTGVLPGISKAAGRGLVWLVRHPQWAIALLVVVSGAWGVWQLVTRSPAFQITQLQLPAEHDLKLSTSLIGQNLWTVDLRALATQLKAQQPHLKRVRVIRRLPNTLQIEVTERVPMAQLRVGQWYPVSSDGFLFAKPLPAPHEDLPILKGVESPQEILKVGRENPGARLHRALRVAEQLQRSPVLRGHQLRAVDVGDANQLTFVIDGNVEIRCGQDAELASHLARLRTVLQTVARQQLAVRYIDVRFKDPVIGPRT